MSTLVIKNGELLRHQTPNKLLDRVIQARRRPHSQKSDRGDRSEQLQVMAAEDSVAEEDSVVVKAVDLAVDSVEDLAEDLEEDSDSGEGKDSVELD